MNADKANPRRMPMSTNTPTKVTPQMNTARLNLHLPSDVLTRLRELARKNDRTLKAEVTRALTVHLAKAGKGKP